MVGGESREERRTVRRERLLRELRAHADVPVVLVVGGAGYGKTMLLDQWCAEQARPVARVRLRPRHDDATALLTALLDELESVEPVAPSTRRRILSSDLDRSSVVLPTFARLLARRERPCTLVLDDLHVLQGASARSVVDVLVDELPAGWQLVLASRADPHFGLGRLTVAGRLLCVEPEALLMDRDESTALLASAVENLDPRRIDTLVRQAEGWPVALSLLAIRERTAGATAGLDLAHAGDDRALARYLREEVLQGLAPATREFLLRTAVVDDLDPSLCDALLDRDDSIAVLRAMADDHVVMRVADRGDERFRIHQLLRDLLRAELQRTEPGLTPALHRRASEWYARHWEFDAAVQHAVATDDAAYADSVVWSSFVPYLGNGFHDTVGRWLDAFPHAVKAARPTLAVVSAWYPLTIGDTAAVRLWAEIAATMDGTARLPDGSTLAANAALLRALVALDGLREMQSDTAAAREGLPSTSMLWSMVLLLQGHAMRLVGEEPEARRVLEEGVALGQLVARSAQTLCLNGLARIAAAHDDWDTAARLAGDALAVVNEFGLDTRPPQSAVLSFSALVAAREGRRDEAERLAKQAAFLVGMLVNLGPWLAVEVRLDLARVALLLGDVLQARGLVDEARALEPLVADSPELVARLRDLEQTLDVSAMPLGIHASSITPAELRVLRYLPTHLTFGAIAEELFVSRNTVKTQAIAIYRKLGVSSRDAAVAEARRLQLLD